MKPVNALWGNIFRSNHPERRAACDLLKRIPLFAGLRRSELRQIERLVHQRSYRNGEVIFWEEEPGVGMYVVQQGEVGIYKSYGKPEQREVERMQAGDFFGEMALLAGDFRQATAVADCETTLLSLIHPELFDLFDRKPHLGVKLLSFLATVVAQRLRKSDQDLQRFAVGRCCGESRKPDIP